MHDPPDRPDEPIAPTTERPPAWPAPDRPEPADPVPGTGGGSPVGAVLAWLVIVATVTAVVVMNHSAPAPRTPGGEDPVALLLTRMQGQYIVGAAKLQEQSGGGSGILYAQARKSLNVGTVGQRQRFVVLAAELQGPDEAADEDDPAAAALLARIDALAAPDRTRLVDGLGWFGELALLPADTADTAGRDRVMVPAWRVVYVLFGAVGGLAVLGLGGFIGLVTLGALCLTGTVRGRFATAKGPHGVYAETFAAWLVLFLALQFAAELVGAAAFGATPLWLVAGAFFLSLAVLHWPVLRGVPWSVARRDIGLHLGRSGAAEVLAGLGGYCMALPILGLGIVGTLALMMVQAMVSPAGDPLAPASGPAHPIIVEIAGGGWWPRVQLLLVAAVAAPIVEETMFRGVLYRHLRESSRWLGPALSVVFSAGVSAFVFAAIHPQGWVAIPALMSLAIAFVVVREWRGSVVPAMIVHAVSNGLVVSMLMLLL
ncbi:MAG: lysostaphin resistance A-like protein [Planctomycetota bacterium]|jgi:membrane protease YdiL (CAAX protease family)